MAIKALSDEDSLEAEVAREIIARGRGDRDEIGIRDQWSSKEHLLETFDSRKPISAKVRRLLKSYRLKCDGCDHNEATEIINEFVIQTKRKARYGKWLERVTIVILALGTTVFLYKTIGTDALAPGVVDDQIRQNIENLRRRSAEEEMCKEAAAKENRAPTWRDNEEKEVWSPRQEKQFDKALILYGGISSAKERYGLIAEKVKDKSRQECQMHHKLLQAIAKDE